MQKSFTTLPTMVQYMVQTYRNSYAFNYRQDDQWYSMSTEVFCESVRRLALGLHDMGLKPGDKVGILARSSPFWLIVDMAVVTAGGVSVPMFAHVSEQNFLHEVKDSAMRYLFVVDGDQWAAVSHHRKLFEAVITHNVQHEQEGDNVHDFNDLLERGDTVSQNNPQLYAELRDRVDADELATIIYTSGSTGMPKGVELTHNNLISQTLDADKRFPMRPKTDRILSVLPLAHVFERMLMYYYMSKGLSIYFVDDIRNVGNIIRDVAPTACAMVPLLLEKIYARMESGIRNAPWPLRTIACAALEAAQKPPVTFKERMMHKIYDKLVYSKLRQEMGGNFRGIISGGAPLNKELCQFFINIGVPIYQGYGLTESSPVLTTNYPDHNKPGTVGRPFPSVKLKLTDEGEILAKGPNIMRGYHNDAQTTRVRIDEDGWLHTGDQGAIDEHGFLTVTGRLKEIIKTSAGKMVAPVPIEQALCRNPFVDMALVIGDSRKFVSALLVPNMDELRQMQKDENLEHLSMEDFLDSKPVKAMTDNLVEEVNDKVNAWEQIKAYRYLFVPLTVEAGELTATMKIRRQVVLEKYTEIIDSMY